MAKTCRRFSAVERVRIELGLREGLSLTRIAAALARPKGTVSKEITRNGGSGSYAPDAAQAPQRGPAAARGPLPAAAAG